MKKGLLFILATCFTFGLQAQTLEEVKAEKAEIMDMIAAKKSELSTLQADADKLQASIDQLSGWITGIGGNIGFNIGGNNNWISMPNPNAKTSSLAFGLTGYANNIKEKTIWRNSFLIDKQWVDIDLDGEGDGDDGLFDNGTVDILNAASLAGYRIHPKVALTGLGEINTSVENFFSPGTADIGVGATWTPNNDLVVIVHPLNYHFAFSGYEDVESTSTLGAKLRAEYNKKFNLAGKTLALQSLFTTFLPYASDTQLITTDSGDSWEADLFEYTWQNKLTFVVWNGIGVNLGFGLRAADFETQDLQTSYSLGLGYTL